MSQQVYGRDITLIYYFSHVSRNNLILSEYCNLISWSAWSNIGYAW